MRRIAGVLLLSACGGGGGDKPKPPPDAKPPCTLSLAGTIAADQTIAKGCTATVTDDVTVTKGTLTLEGGATVAFLDGRSLTVGAGADAAKLVVTGTADAPVSFVLAGDNLPGAWGQVHLGKGAAGSSLAGLSIAHAGKDGRSAILVEAADVSITGTTIKDVAGVGVELAPALSFAAFSGNHIEASKELVKLGPEAVSSLGDGNTYGAGGVIAVVPGTLSRSVTWRAQGAPYLVDDLLKVEMQETRGNLTLDAGVEVRFTAKAGLAVGVGHPGGLRISGTAAAPVTLTSIDGKPSAWTLWVGRQGEVVIENAVIANGGSDHDTGAVAVRGGSLEVYGTSFHDDIVGLTADAKAKLKVDGCTFANDSLFAIALQDQLGALGKNTYDAGAKIEMRGGTIDADVTWKPQTMVWWSGKVAVDKGTLTVEAGNQFTMMSPDASLQVGSAPSGKKKAKKPPKAALVFAGTADQPITLAGVRASPSTWGNIVLAGDQDSKLANVQLSGSGGAAAIVVGDGARVALQNVTCEQCAGAVVTRTCGAQVTIDDVKAGAGTPADTIEPACQLVSVPATAPPK